MCMKQARRGGGGGEKDNNTSEERDAVHASSCQKQAAIFDTLTSTDTAEFASK